MPHIFDNIENSLLPALRKTLDVSHRADFCVGYFNLRGWKHLASYAEQWQGGDGNCFRLLIGMQITPSDEVRAALRIGKKDEMMDNATAIRHKREIAKEFRNQLTFGVPTNEDEETLQKLARQLRAGKIQVKIHLAYPLHAKLYLMHRQDPVSPIVAYLGSSNLTMAGLVKQGELNVDVVDSDATQKLADWFIARWEDRLCIDISDELADIIDESWASETPRLPYHIYLKMAYHLAEDAIEGVGKFKIPGVFKNVLFDYQAAAVQIAAGYLDKRGGVLIGDVVGLGKTMMATAVAKIFEEEKKERGFQTLIICPKNLEHMWGEYKHKYRLLGDIIPVSQVIEKLEKTPRYQVVLIDESHNLRNKDSKRWRAIRDYIERNKSVCILLSATPYNKSYLDLAAQLALFLPPTNGLSIRPEKYIAQLGGERQFMDRHQCQPKTLAAFEKSEYPTDWQNLMRLFMVRRTRSFIIRHYAKKDANGEYLQLADGSKSYFCQRIPQTLKFPVTDGTKPNQYARYYSQDVVDGLNELALPRYGMRQYVVDAPTPLPNDQEQKTIDELTRAGGRLKGFCRINLFKRLESSGPSFITSLDWHILRNFTFLHALDNGLPLPIGSLDAHLLNPNAGEIDDEPLGFEDDEGMDRIEAMEDRAEIANPIQYSEASYEQRAATRYNYFRDQLHTRFKWLPPSVFNKKLAKDLRADAKILRDILQQGGEWNVEADAKLNKLASLIKEKHGKEKLLVFTQFVDTAKYLADKLEKVHGIDGVGLATGGSKIDPSQLARQFSPRSNNAQADADKRGELRVLITTDVLSEGQNLQDCAIVVNYDLPWAIIRLIQRAGRVDRIGQSASVIRCYSFLPADGIEKVIRLRERVKQRLRENAEVVGTDEMFFDDDKQVILNIYDEKSGILDDTDDNDDEVDLASYAYQIWHDAIRGKPSLAKQIEGLPKVVYATKAKTGTGKAASLTGDSDRGGVLVYARTAQGSDSLAWIDENGKSVTDAHRAILNAAACDAKTKALPRLANHHQLTDQGIVQINETEKQSAGSLGPPNSPRRRTYDRLKNYRRQIAEEGGLFIDTQNLADLDKVCAAIYNHTLQKSAIDALRNKLKTSPSDAEFATFIISRHSEGKLCNTDPDASDNEPRLICSMGLA